MNLIRNFSIIAHIDHGKSTLADRLIEYCGGLTAKEMQAQVLDSMELEKERGITIKAQTAALRYTAKDHKTYQLNLIDTPGHVDFSYEVSRSLLACEGALLVIDAGQGVEAQTVANCYAALDLGLTVLPVINKIDLPQADPERVKQEVAQVIGIDSEQAVCCSAKTGLGIQDILEALVAFIPAPTGSVTQPLQALIIDSWFDNYVGVVMLARIVNGTIQVKDHILLMAQRSVHVVEKIGIFTPKAQAKDRLQAGQVGFIIAGIRDISATKVGDTITSNLEPATAPLPGFQEAKPQVFAGLYPVESHQFESLRDALEKLKLNDAALHYEPDVSQALGFGFRCGFLGLLHMDIVQERLEREFNIDLITTAPSVVYQVLQKNGTILQVENPSKLPEIQQIEEIREPIISLCLYFPEEYIGAIMTLCHSKRSQNIELTYRERQVQLNCEMPMAEMVFDFFDRLKSVSRGYASMDYAVKDYRAADLVKVDLLINGQKVDALSSIHHRSAANYWGREILLKMRTIIPRQMFEIALQAAIGHKIIARESIKALRKNVLAKCYGGDISRKKKLLEKQKQGKKRMKQIGQVEIPQEAFHAVLQVKSET